MITYDSATDRGEVLEEFRKSSGQRVLLACSMSRGIDLPDDQCRVVVITKTPYAYLGSPQVRRRKDIDPVWYKVNVARELVQISGRGVRHAQDYCVTFILDAEAERFYSQNPGLFPAWWRWAVHKSKGGQKG